MANRRERRLAEKKYRLATRDRRRAIPHSTLSEARRVVKDLSDQCGSVDDAIGTLTTLRPGSDFRRAYKQALTEQIVAEQVAGLDRELQTG